MKKFIILLLLYLVSSSAFSIDSTKYSNNINNNSLNSYLLDILHKQYKAREDRLEKALQSESQLKLYQEDIKLQYKRLLFDFPNNIRTAIPEADTIGEINNESYSIQKLIIANRITTNLYLPYTKGTKPAILLFCGHEMSSKATESYQKTAILLVKQGFIVFVIDPSGQGERVQLVDNTGKNLTRGATTEHTLLNTGAGLIGWSLIQEELMDNTLCMNYLASRTDVDLNNIGCIGNSGGGTQTTYFSALDNRVKATVCCSWFTQRERMFKKYGPDDGCQYLWNEGRAQLDIPDYYIMQAPRPFLILAGEKDFIDYKGSREGFKELKKCYSIFNQSENVDYFAYNDGHGISQPKREKAAEFFLLHLKNKALKISEGDLITESDSSLNCTKSGQVRVDFPKTESLAARSLNMATYYAKNRKGFSVLSTDSCRRIVQQILNLPQTTNSIKSKLIDSNKKSVFDTETYIISKENEPDFLLQALIPKDSTRGEIFVLLSDSGMQNPTIQQKAEQIIKKGNIVILMDPRGIGTSKDNPKKNNKKFFNDDYRNSALSMFIGRPILGQRVVDILSTLDFISSTEELAFLPVNVISNGNIGIAVIHAAFLDDRISKFKTNNCIDSWIDIIKDPIQKNRLSLVAANALIHYDIPQLIKK